MNTARTSFRRFAPVTAAALLVVAGTLFAGPLNPPTGPVTSTMKTMTEVEPRIAINAANTPGDSDATFVITQPGSYYLTSNLSAASGKHGIQVLASNVDIDLNGFVLQGPGSGTTNGIVDTLDELNTQSNLRVRNGKILGFNTGIWMEWIGGVHAEDLRIDAISNGITVNGGGEAVRCEVTGPGITSSGMGVNIDGPATITGVRSFGFYTGINASSGSVRESHAESCVVGMRSGGMIESCTVTNCTTGIEADARSTIRRCTIDFGSVGIRVTGMQATVSENSLTSQSQAGVRVEFLNARVEHNTITGNSSTSPSATGIVVPVNYTGSYIDDNVIRQMGSGINVASPNNVIVRNSVSTLTSAGVAYSIVTGNRFGPLVKAVNGGAITVTSSSANTTGSFATTDVNSNLFW